MYLITICTLTVQCTPENAGDSLSISEDNIPNGVVYSDIVNFDANENPYLVIFLADSGYTTASCHVWKYDEETENAERITILDVNYNQIPLGQSGVFSLGSNAEKTLYNIQGV